MISFIVSISIICFLTYLWSTVKCIERYSIAMSQVLKKKGIITDIDLDFIVNFAAGVKLERNNGE